MVAQVGMSAIGFLANLGLASQGLKSLGNAAGGTLDFVHSILGATNALSQWSNSLAESNRDMVKWNGQIAKSFAELDLQKMRMERTEANIAAPGIDILNQEVAAFQKEIEALKIASNMQWTTFKADFMRGLTFLFDIAQKATGMDDKLAGIQKQIDKNTGTPTAAQKFLEDVNAGKFAGWRQKPIIGVGTDKK